MSKNGKVQELVGRRIRLTQAEWDRIDEMATDLGVEWATIAIPALRSGLSDNVQALAEEVLVQLDAEYEAQKARVKALYNE